MYYMLRAECISFLFLKIRCQEYHPSNTNFFFGINLYVVVSL